MKLVDGEVRERGGVMRRLGGWWRLWFAVSGLWVVLAAGIGITAIVNTESAADRMKFSVELACPAPKPWRDVIASPAFRQLTPDLQEAARQQYFREVVASQLSDPGQIAEAKAQFDAEYGPSAEGPWTKYQKAAAERAENPPDLSDTIKLPELKARERCNEAKQRDYAIDVSKSRTDAAISTVLGAASVPLILLILGLLTGWVVRGFRDSSSKK